MFSVVLDIFERNRAESKGSTVRNNTIVMIRSFIIRGLVTCLLANPGVTCRADEREIRVTPVTIRLIRECEVPAHDSGVLEKISVLEGMPVKEGDLLAMLESRQQELTVELAKLNFEASEEEASNDLAVLAAEEGLLEARSKLKTLELALNVAKNISDNKSAVEIAKTDQATSKTQLERAKTARSQFDKSVSEAEMIRLTADFRKSELSVSEAESKQLTSELQVHVHTAELEEQQATISRNRHLVEQERRKLKQAARTSETRRVELDLAKAMLDRRKVMSPLTGIVVRHSRQPGEFVEAGTPILRVIQLDRLRAEGFVEVAIASPALKNRSVRIEVTGIGARKKTLSGVITFVGQEVDPLNQQVRVWAEFESPELDVYPGMTAEMTILSGGSPTPTTQPVTGLPENTEPLEAGVKSVDPSASVDSPGER